MVMAAVAASTLGDDAAPGRRRMRDWGRVSLAEMQQQQQHQHQHQHHHYVPVPELQQLLMETGRAANGAFFREPANGAGSNPSPIPPAPQFRMMDDRHILHQLVTGPSQPPAAPLQHRAAAAVPLPMGEGSSSFKLLPAPRDEGEEDDERNSSGGGSSSRWPSQEAQALIKIRAEMDGHFKYSMLPKAVLWDEVSRKLGILGYSRDARKCKEKFENLCKYYRRTKEGKAEGKSYKYFDELEALFKKQNNDNNNANNVNINSLNEQREAGHLLTLIADGACSERKEEICKADGGSKPQDDENSSSESSADYDEQGDEQKGVGTTKRAKKSSWKARFAYIENMVKKFMEKQEAAQLKFLELLEKREQERMKKDESWRKQEIERLNREYELRMEEHSRRLSYDAALVSALQKATGHVIEVPQPPAPSPYSHTNNVTEGNVDEQNPQLSNKDDSNNKRWPKPEVQALIQLRVAMEPRFQEVGPKGQFWDEIATRMSYQGYHRSAKRCKEKWENINKYYRKTCSKKRPENAKTCPYFQELDALYQKGVIGTPGCNRSSAPGSHKLEETTDDLEDTSNRDDSSHAQGEAEVLSLPGGAGNNTPSNATTNTTTGLFSSPENCVNNTESRLPSAGNNQQNTNRVPAQKRSWIDGSGNGSSLGLGFDAGSSDLFVGSSNKTLKFDGFAKDILDAHSRQFDEQQRTSSQRHQQQEEHHQHHHHHLQQLLQGRQGQDFQEVESRGCNLVDSFGLGGLGSSR